jgi:hypothetical protein
MNVSRGNCGKGAKYFQFGTLYSAQIHQNGENSFKTNRFSDLDWD